MIGWTESVALCGSPDDYELIMLIHKFISFAEFHKLLCNLLVREWMLLNSPDRCFAKDISEMKNQ